MKPDQNTWINKVLGSLTGSLPAEPSPFLYAKIRNRLTAGKPANYLPARTVWLVIASFGLLLLLNWRVLAQLDTREPNGLEAVVEGLQLLPASNSLYDVWSGPNY